MSNIVYIATSIDGYISASDGSLDWLDSTPNPDDDDMGFYDFMQRIDAIVMGRVTFETVVGFGLGWHYPKPGIILSSTLDKAPDAFAGQVQFSRGAPGEVMKFAQQQGFNHLYIDGGNTIQRFLQVDLIDEMIITEIPVLLGGGTRLFTQLGQQLEFTLVGTETYLGQLVTRHYRRQR